MNNTKTQNILIKTILSCVAFVVWVRALFGRKPEKWPQKTSEK